MITPVQGTWTFSVWGEVRGRNVSRQQQLDLVMVELPDTVYLRYEDQEVKCGLCSLEISTDTPSSRCEMMTGSAPSPRGWGASPWSAWRRAAAPSPASASSPGAATSPRSRARAAGSSAVMIHVCCLIMCLQYLQFKYYLLIISCCRFCRAPGRDSVCLLYEVEITADMSGDTLRWGTVQYSALRYRDTQ